MDLNLKKIFLFQYISMKQLNSLRKRIVKPYHKLFFNNILHEHKHSVYCLYTIHTQVMQV